MGVELGILTELHETDLRSYDSQLGRFTQIDALTEIFAEITPYQYSFNNPIIYSDPSGLCPDCKS